MNQGEASSFLNDPIGVGSTLNEEFSNKEAYFFVLEAVVFLDKTIKDGSKRIVIERVGFVDLSKGQDQLTSNFVIAIRAGYNESCLFVVVGLLIDVKVFVSE